LVLTCLLFNFSKAQYTINESTTYLMYSYAAYCPNLTSWDCFWCTYVDGVPPIKVLYTFENTSSNTVGYAGVTSNSIIFAFRGTLVDSIKNWITDLESYSLTPFPYVPTLNVGTGFLDAYEDIRSDVFQAASTLISQYPNYPIYFVGHSLGAALSTLAAADVAANLNPPSIFSWTYGDPRTGDGNFSNYLGQAFSGSWRTVNQDDIVPHVPLSKWGFEQIGIEIWFPDNTTSFVECEEIEDPNCSDSVDPLDWSVLDHLYYLGYLLEEGLPYGCS